MNNSYRRYIVADLEIDGGKVYSPLFGGGALLKGDIESGETEVLCEFRKEANLEYYNMYNAIVRYGDNLIFVPASADELAVYNLISKDVRYIGLKEVSAKGNEIYDRQSKFWNAVKTDEYLYMFGYYYPAIIRMNLVTFEIEYINDWVTKIDKHIPPEDARGYIGNGHYVEGSDIIVPFMCAPALLRLNTDTLSTEIELLNTSLDGMGTLSCDGEYIYLQGKGDSIGRFSKVSIIDRMVVFDGIQIEDVERVDYSVAFAPPVLAGDRLFLLPQEGKKAYELITSDMDLINPAWGQFLIEFENEKDQWISCVKIVGRKVYFITNHDKLWHEFDLETENIRHFEMLLPEKYVAEEMMKKISLSVENNVPLTEKDVDLNTFIESI